MAGHPPQPMPRPPKRLLRRRPKRRPRHWCLRPRPSRSSSRSMSPATSGSSRKPSALMPICRMARPTPRASSIRRSRTSTPPNCSPTSRSAARTPAIWSLQSRKTRSSTASFWRATSASRKTRSRPRSSSRRGKSLPVPRFAPTSIGSSNSIAVRAALQPASNPRSSSSIRTASMWYSKFTKAIWPRSGRSTSSATIISAMAACARKCTLSRPVESSVSSSPTILTIPIA